MSLAMAGLHVNLRMAVLACDVCRISDHTGDQHIVQLNFDDLIVGLTPKSEADMKQIETTNSKQINSADSFFQPNSTELLLRSCLSMPMSKQTPLHNMR